ncbi:MAG TPA: hypothetical protein EYG98_06085 [Sulfurovum sp.]|nr:hypothetical protein [Sulfurovum sp.]
MKEERKSTFTVEELTEEKARLLAEFKDHGEKIDYAEDEYSEDIINQDREKLAIRIKALGKKIREIEQQNA